MSTTPKMTTSAPITVMNRQSGITYSSDSLSPEQIRAICGEHRKLMAQRRRIRVRTAVRIIFWGSLAIGAWLTLAHFGLLPDDYRDTCESLGQVCPK